MLNLYYWVLIVYYCVLTLCYEAPKFFYWLMIFVQRYIQCVILGTQYHGLVYSTCTGAYVSDISFSFFESPCFVVSRLMLLFSSG